MAKMMDSASPLKIIVPLSKSKVALLFLGALTFVVACIWMWSFADVQSRFNPLSVRIVAVAGICLFGMCAVFGGFKLFDRKPGLIIDDQGIVDNSSAIAAGRIFWHEIIGLNVTTVAGQRFLVIHVAEPQKFVKRGNPFIQIVNAANAKMMGSPINISSNSLRWNFDELLHALIEAFEKHKVSDDATWIRQRDLP